MRTHTHTPARTHTHTHSCTHMHACTNTHTHSPIHTLTHTHIHIHTLTLTHTHTHTLTHTLSHSHTHTLTHTYCTWAASLHSTTLVLKWEVAALLCSARLLLTTKAAPTGRWMSVVRSGLNSISLACHTHQALVTKVSKLLEATTIISIGCTHASWTLVSVGSKYNFIKNLFIDNS